MSIIYPLYLCSKEFPKVYKEIWLTGSRLPFLLPLNCALSIAVKSYLDELFNQPDPTATDAKEQVKETASTRYFPQSENFIGDLDTAFKLWDAVFEGVKSSGNLVKESDKKLWSDANAWLTPRR